MDPLQHDPREALERNIRRGYRNGAIDAGCGVAVVLVVFALLRLLADTDPAAGAPHLAELWFLPSAACLGGGIGLLTRIYRISALVRHTIGTDYGGLRRLARVVVRGKAEELTPEEEQVAPLYAAVISRTLPYSLSATGANLSGVLFVQLAGLDSRSADVFRLVLVAAIAAVLVWGFISVVLNTRRARAYAAAHPVVSASA